MKTHSIGTTKLVSSVIGFGAWSIGGTFWGGTDRRQAVNAICAALDNGINLIDTAPIYGFGLSENIVGEAISNCRDKVILSTKCGLRWDKEEGFFSIVAGGKRIYHNLSKTSIRHEIENSLKRLKTDYIDIYYTHWPDQSTPLDETINILLTLKKEGKIRSIGVSNVKMSHLLKYEKSDELDAVQLEYNMLNRRAEQKTLPFCEKKNISFLAYCPLAQGLLSGKIQSKHKFKNDDMRRKMRSFSEGNLIKAKNLSSQLMAIANTYNITQTQLVLAWTLAQNGVTHILCGMRTPAQVKENSMAAKISLKNHDIALIREIAKKSNVLFALHF